MPRPKKPICTHINLEPHDEKCPDCGLREFIATGELFERTLMTNAQLKRYYPQVFGKYSVTTLELIESKIASTKSLK